ncbi:outer membrane protein [Paenirhodobacter sp.]|uniref:outer membrane protein n=1 Tax=Paenirhodobacter sp. TaxID=1965326 RepID=UPI003B413614
MRDAGMRVLLSFSFMVGAGAVSAGGYSPAPVEPAAVSAVVQDWNGAYVGATLGYAFGADDRIGLAYNGVVHSTGENFKLHGLNGGLRLGYRTQINRWVFGPELSIEGGSVKDSFDRSAYDEDFDETDWANGKTKLKHMAALRLKAGYLVNDKTLFYGIAGVAKSKYDYKLAEGTDADTDFQLDRDFSRTGYVVGLGVERKLTERVSLTAEYEYANFGKKALAGDFGVITQATPKFSNIKIGVNFSF